MTMSFAISQRSGSGLHLVYMALQGRSAALLFGCEFRRPPAAGLATIPSFRDDHGLLLVQALPAGGQNSTLLEERRCLRVL